MGFSGPTVAVYMRVSSASQQVRSQRREIERYLKAHQLADVEWFTDEGVSGAVMDRPGLASMRRAIFDGTIGTVVLYSLDRLARNAVEGMNLIAEWLRRDVRLVVVTTQMDFSGDVGGMIASLLLHIAQMERTRIRERQAAGIAAAKEAGKHWGGRKPGVGWKADQGRVLALRERGLTYGEIGKALGVSSRTVSRMLQRASNRNH